MEPTNKSMQVLRWEKMLTPAQLEEADERAWNRAHRLESADNLVGIGRGDTEFAKINVQTYHDDEYERILYGLVTPWWRRPTTWIFVGITIAAIMLYLAANGLIKIQ